MLLHCLLLSTYKIYSIYFLCYYIVYVDKVLLFIVFCTSDFLRSLYVTQMLIVENNNMICTSHLLRLGIITNIVMTFMS